jgi:hypothetical protein
MKKTVFATAVLSVAAAISLTACGSKTDANEKNFRAAIEQRLEKNGDLCLNTTEWPQNVGNMLPNFNDDRDKFPALAKRGILNSEDFEVQYGYARSWATRYSPSDAAKPFLREIGEGNNKKTHLCWGKMRLDKIVKWNTPDAQGVTVVYTYKIDDLADWAKDEDFRKGVYRIGLGTIGGLIDGAGTNEQDTYLQLTNLGWE